MMKILNSVMVGSLCMSGVALAEADASKWGGEAELGVVATGGNTETQSVNGKVKVTNERDKWRHMASLEFLQTEDAVQTTAEKYTFASKSDYKLDQLSYVFGTVKYEDDRFSGYDYRASEVIGYGRRVINQDNLTLNLEAGPGARQSKLTSTGVSDSEGVLLLAGDLGWQISDTSKLTEELSSEIGDSATISKSVTGLKTQINGSLAMKISYSVKYTSDVPVNIEKTDRETAVTLVYGF